MLASRDLFKDCPVSGLLVCSSIYVVSYMWTAPVCTAPASESWACFGNKEAVATASQWGTSVSWKMQITLGKAKRRWGGSPCGVLPHTGFRDCLASGCECEQGFVWVQLSVIDPGVADTEPHLQWLENTRDKHMSWKGWVLARPWGKKYQWPVGDTNTRYCLIYWHGGCWSWSWTKS